MGWYKLLCYKALIGHAHHRKIPPVLIEINCPQDIPVIQFSHFNELLCKYSWTAEGLCLTQSHTGNQHHDFLNQCNCHPPTTLFLLLPASLPSSPQPRFTHLFIEHPQDFASFQKKKKKTYIYIYIYIYIYVYQRNKGSETELWTHVGHFKSGMRLLETSL